MTAAARWAQALSEWSIPAHILAGAPESPWIHPAALFTVAGPIPDSPSHQRAREVQPESVIDVGCGGGRAAMALVPPVREVVGVDQQAAMLEAFAIAAEAAGAAHTEILGDWPESATITPVADVVVCHHVAYNVALLGEFATALAEHGRRRVVLELPQHHPLAHMSPAWQHFWGLERPSEPTAHDALEVLVEAGLPARIELWTDGSFQSRAGISLADQARFMRIRLYLPAVREPDVLDFLRSSSPEVPRAQATIWWDSTN